MLYGKYLQKVPSSMNWSHSRIHVCTADIVEPQQAGIYGFMYSYYNFVDLKIIVLVDAKGKKWSCKDNSFFGIYFYWNLLFPTFPTILWLYVLSLRKNYLDILYMLCNKSASFNYFDYARTTISRYVRSWDDVLNQVLYKSPYRYHQMQGNLFSFLVFRFWMIILHTVRECSSADESLGTQIKSHF